MGNSKKSPLRRGGIFIVSDNRGALYFEDEFQFIKYSLYLNELMPYQPFTKLKKVFRILKKHQKVYFNRDVINDYDF